MIFSDITPLQFKNWRIKLGYSPNMCAKKLGLSVSTIFNYEKGVRLEGEVKIPLTVALAMSAVMNNLEPYKGISYDNHTSE